jgi:hypothetical protein
LNHAGIKNIVKRRVAMVRDREIHDAGRGAEEISLAHHIRNKLDAGLYRAS